MPPFIWIDHGIYTNYVPRASADRLKKVHQMNPSKGIKEHKVSDRNTKTDQYESYTESPSKEKNPYFKSSETLQSEISNAKIARHIMTTTIISVSPDTILKEILKTFSINKIRHIPIVDLENHLLGITSERDLLRYLANSTEKEAALQNTIQEIMNKKVLTIRQEARITEIARVMVEEKVGCMPVLSDENKLIGLVTRGDVLSTLVYSGRININV